MPLVVIITAAKTVSRASDSALAPPDAIRVTISATSITVTATASTSDPNGSPSRCAITSACCTAASTAPASTRATTPTGPGRVASPGRREQGHREHRDRPGARRGPAGTAIRTTCCLPCQTAQFPRAGLARACSRSRSRRASPASRCRARTETGPGRTVHQQVGEPEPALPRPLVEPQGLHPGVRDHWVRRVSIPSRLTTRCSPTPPSRNCRRTGATQRARAGGAVSGTSSGSGDPYSASSSRASASTSARRATGITVEVAGPRSESAVTGAGERRPRAWPSRSCATGTAR